MTGGNESCMLTAHVYAHCKCEAYPYIPDLRCIQIYLCMCMHKYKCKHTTVLKEQSSVKAGGWSCAVFTSPDIRESLWRKKCRPFHSFPTFLRSPDRKSVV